MDARIVSIAPSVVLAIAVVIAQRSGNDKSPFLVLLVLGLLVIVLLGAVSMVLIGGPARARALPLALGALVPLLYAGLVIVLARHGLLDSLPFLGIR